MCITSRYSRSTISYDCAGPVIDVPVDVVERTYDTNVFSILRMCKAVVPHMAARKSGTIINISSITAY